MIYRFGETSLDTRLLQLRNGHDPVAAEPQVFDLLLYLLKHRDRVVARDELFQKLWAGKVVGDAALNACVKAARKVVGDSGRTQQVIKTVHGRGYQFTAGVTEIADDVLAGPAGPETNTSGKSEPSRDRPSILVLPFANQSANPDDEYFAVGITDEIRLDLCRFRSIVVIARDSSMELKISDPLLAARHLNVDYVLVGSVQRASDRIRVSARLLNAASGEQVWAERYDRELRDAFEVQEDLAQRIIGMLVDKIEATARERAMRKPPVDLTAYDYLLRGNYYFNDWHASEQDITYAEEMYTRALEVDPGCAAAYIGLASVQVHRLDAGLTNSPEDTGEAAIRFARRAVELDAQDSSARLALANAYFFAQSNHDQATAQIRIALELNPNDYHSYCFGGWICMCSGELEEGARCSSEAIQRSPLLPDDCLGTIGCTEYLMGHYDAALRAFSRILEPDSTIIACIAACYGQLDESEKATHAAADFLNRVVDDPGEDAVRSREYWADVFDFKDPARFEHLMEGMHKAGLVE